MKNYTPIINAIQKLISGNYDTPINKSGDKSTYYILNQLETLRINLRNERINQLATKNAIDDTVAKVAHDLKTPLAVIMGYAECLQEGISDKDYASLIIEKTAEMNEQVINIVEINRAKEMLDTFEPIECSIFFRAECEKYAKLAENKNISFIIKKIPKTTIFGSRKSISGIIQNLISNAIKYTEKGGKIYVRFDKSARYFYMTVKDNGIGISKEDLPYVFDKYFMADKARNNKNSSGLGLYSVKEAIHYHGGKTKVSSKLKKGSSFTVSFPIEESSQKHKFDNLNPIAKILIYTFSFPFLPSVIYRIAKGINENNPKLCLSGLFHIIIFPFIWISDIINLIIFNKIFYH